MAHLGKDMTPEREVSLLPAPASVVSCASIAANFIGWCAATC